MKEKFNIGNVIVEQTSVKGLTLDSVGLDRNDFLTREEEPVPVSDYNIF